MKYLGWYLLLQNVANVIAAVVLIDRLPFMLVGGGFFGAQAIVLWDYVRS